MSKIIIHRGAHIIGGSCIEISSDGHRIIFDIGMPLMEKGGNVINKRKLTQPTIENGILPEVKGLYKDQQPEIEALFVSHAHIDHYGLLNFVHPSIPVYMSRGSQALIDIGTIFYPEQNKIHYDNISLFRHWRPVEVGPFKVTSYLMDHSGYDASAFLIETAGEKIFYSGDFRGHGRKAKLLDHLANSPISDVNCLLIEGTTMGGGHKDGFETEQDVEDALRRIFSNQDDLSCIMAAGSNIDRMVSLYKAAARSNKTLVMDLYTYYVLTTLKRYTPALPPHPDDHLRIYYTGRHAQNIVDHVGKKVLYQFAPRKIEIDQIVADRQNMVLKLPVSAMDRIASRLAQNRPLSNAAFIYSMWSGYLDKDAQYTNFCQKYQLNLKKVHVSGHAYRDSLEKLVNSLTPDVLVPVHTLSADMFESYFENVVQIDDGEAFEL
jgi:ribonuclease J